MRNTLRAIQYRPKPDASRDASVKKPVPKVALGLGLLVVTLTGFLMYEGTSPKRIGIAVCAMNLKSLLTAWERNGSPADIDIRQYIPKSSDRFFVFTNSYRVGNGLLRCQFAVDSDRFGGEGFLAITTNRHVLWIDTQGVAVVVSFQ